MKNKKFPFFLIISLTWNVDLSHFYFLLYSGIRENCFYIYFFCDEIWMDWSRMRETFFSYWTIFYFKQPSAEWRKQRKFSSISHEGKFSFIISIAQFACVAFFTFEIFRKKFALSAENGNYQLYWENHLKFNIFFFRN